MKISVSNIAWERKDDEEMYLILKSNGVEGIEIAPTRIFPENPYGKLEGARQYQKKLYEDYGLSISSIQSIWYGRNEEIFADKTQRRILIDYTKHAFEFAHAMKCNNLVFGCPKNRNIHSENDLEIAVDFFSELGELAVREHTVLALEANPSIYHTNFLNTTKQVYEMVKEIRSDGIKVNYDLGTVIQNKENIVELRQMMTEINHVHISEPFLADINYGSLHVQLIKLLKEQKYDKFVSIEMKNLKDIGGVKKSIQNLCRMVL